MADRLHKLIIKGTLVSKPEAKHNLFCFPWAGGGAAQFIRWDKQFPPHIQVLAVRLPGRETRLTESPYHSVDEFAADAARLISEHYRDRPFSFLGHSFGSRLALETARTLKEKYSLEPKTMFVSGAFGPGSVHGSTQLSKRIPEELTDSNLIAYLRKLGGTPEEVLENKDLLKMILPSLRADLHCLRSYSYSPSERPPVDCPLFVMDGKDDIDHVLQEWRGITSGHFQIDMFPGGHFFLLEPGVQPSVTEHVVKLIKQFVED